MSQKVDLVPLIEWAIKRNDPELTRVRRKKEVLTNPFEILDQKRRELQQWEAWVKDLDLRGKGEKAAKEKPWHEKVNTPQLAMMILLLVPIYMVILQKIIH